MAEYSVIGQRVPLIDADERVTGTAQFTNDLKLPRMLHAKILTSPHAHAKITSIDTSHAEALPGVKAVVTHEDCVGLGLIQMDQPILSDTVRFVGDVVAAVAATDKYIAEEALNLIDVQYEVLPFVLDPIQAMEPGAWQVHPEITDNNVASVDPLFATFGDVEAGFAEADEIVENTVNFQSISACAAEPRVTVASWDASGKLTVWSTQQSPSEQLGNLAGIFGIPVTKIRFITTYQGGCFGNKYLLAFEPLTALIARKAGRPVKLAFIASEEINDGRLQHSAVMELKLGLKNDGTITAVQAKCILDTGAYVDCGIGVLDTTVSNFVSARIFKCPNVEAEGYCVYTNKPIAGAYRGWGSIQSEVSREPIFDRAAEKIGMDPVEFRLKNLWASREESLANGGDLCLEWGVPECIRQGAEAIGWQSKWKGWDQPVAVNGAKRRGIGMAATSHGGGGGWAGQGTAIVRLKDDGTIHLITAVAVTGGGQKTVLAQVCAEAVGARYEDIAVTFGDTDTGPYTYGTYGDRTSHGQSISVKEAAEKVKSQLLERAAGVLSVTPGELEAENSQIYVKADPGNSVSFADLVWVNWNLPDIMGTGASTGSPMGGTAGGGAHFAEVEVDTETGHVEVLKLVAAHDFGTAINPTLVENQIMGGIMQGGLGISLREGIVTDPITGAVLNPNWLGYKVNTALETPQIDTILVETSDPDATYGIRGGGNPPLTLPIPAILSAIRNAIGIDLKETPATPDNILKALGKI